MTPPVITLHSLTTGYRTRRGPVEITRGIDAELPAGALTCLLGPNGAGKSTLLRTLAGFQPPLQGAVEVEGAPLASYAPARLARIIGVVLTERVMVADMTVEQLVAAGRAPYTGFWGRLGARDSEVVARAMHTVGIEHMASRMLQTLSDGERQKAMIAKALAQETPVIFLDEPTAFLDYPSRIDMMRLLLKLAHSEGKTVFLSTHDVELALRTADCIWLLDRRLGLTRGVPPTLTADGSVERYFARPGVRFNPEACSFIIEPL